MSRKRLADRGRRSGVGPALVGFLCSVLLVNTVLAEDPQFLPSPERSDPASLPLLDIARAGERLVAVGDRGLVAVSDDRGDTWRQVPLPVSATLTAVTFPTPDAGWAVGHGGVILHSGDGGLNWSLQFDGRAANEALLGYAREQVGLLEATLESAAEADQEALAYALEDAEFLVEDAELAVETGPADPFLDVCFMDAQHGFAAGAYGMLYRTADAGATWEIAIAGVDNPQRFHFYALYCDGEGSLYLAGEAGLLFHSSDGGDSFERFEDVYDGSLFGLLPLGEGVLAYGLRGHLFYRSGSSPHDGRGEDDGADRGDGAGWEALSSPSEASLYGGTRLDDGSLLLAGAGGTLLRLTANRDVEVLQHPARETFSSALAVGDRVWLAGVGGLANLSEAVAP